ncbi:MAG: flagellar basal-body rod protein FlgG [Candidatus Gastranaerophilales bacterium]|nr:flagellar basal-body rod protein FlgG [Candidatus Gastranaerophilales bacterium]
MLRSLSTAATGMIAQQMNIDVIANNVANVNTSGFKKVRAEFQELLSQQLKSPGAFTDQGTTQPVGIAIGLGTKTSATTRNFTPGTMQATGGKFDIAIEGDGFFQIQLSDGSLAYTRDGNFKVDANGQLTTTDGSLLQPAISIPQDAVEVTITPDGRVSVKTGTDINLTETGQIQPVRFLNPAGLTSIGRNLFKETNASGTPFEGIAGQDGFGTIQQGFVEGSNVQIVEEMINLIQAERAFESNSKVVSSSNEILRQTNQLR